MEVHIGEPPPQKRIITITMEETDARLLAGVLGRLSTLKVKELVKVNNSNSSWESKNPATQQPDVAYHVTETLYNELDEAGLGYA